MRLLFAVPGLFLATALMLGTAAPAYSDCPSHLPPPLKADPIPPNDSDVCGTRNVESFAHMAWQTFKYLVWPAKSTSRGLADEDSPIENMSGPRVFETYKADWEVFPTIAEKDWEKYPQVSFCQSEDRKPIQLSFGSLVLGSLDKFQSVTQPGTGMFGHALMAQNGSLVRYQTAFDRTAFDHIAQLDASVGSDFSTEDPTGNSIAAFGSMTIKSAWIEVRNGIPDSTEFHVRPAWVQDPSTGACRKGNVALVGLHIVHKTKSSPQWVWASFEHKKNAPLRGKPVAGFTFHDGSAVPMPFAPPTDSLTRPPSMFAPYNVERLHAIEDQFERVNGIWERAMTGTVWLNYKLVVVQWPEVSGVTGTPDRPTTLKTVRPAPPCLVSQLPVNMANAVMETFLQSATTLDCVMARNLEHTCMGCHYRAHNHDFIWAIPRNRNSGDPEADRKNRQDAFSVLRGITNWNVR